MTALPPDDEMERAYRTRDVMYDGLFVFGVRTTGIVCRPTCPARKPLPQNVVYFPTASVAIAAGYRPCKRCRPQNADDNPPWVANLLNQIESNPAVRITDNNLRTRGVDPGTVRRFFRRKYGMTFRAFVRGQRLAGAHQRVALGQTVDAAVATSGYDSHSGFRDAFARTFGQPPGSTRGRPCVVLTRLPSPLGTLTAAATSDGICFLEFADSDGLVSRAPLERLLDAPVVPGTNEHIQLLRRELAYYFAGKTRIFTVPLVIKGSPFQKLAWAELLNIPYGTTRSYEAVATAIGAPAAVRAVGRANGANRLAILIPCHRVVNKSGSLGGYGGGLRRKEYLLNHERATLGGAA
jgi:AraC family transcriptional regulator, regulatory protein of adaptative response / methylated-DNA-[protein]-cysteine methyltransferase